MWNANQCNQRCEDVFFRNGLDKPMMEYIYPEMEAEDWTVNTGNASVKGWQKSLMARYFRPKVQALAMLGSR